VSETAFEGAELESAEGVDYDEAETGYEADEYDDGVYEHDGATAPSDDEYDESWRPEQFSYEALERAVAESVDRAFAPFGQAVDEFYSGESEPEPAATPEEIGEFVGEALARAAMEEVDEFGRLDFDGRVALEETVRAFDEAVAANPDGDPDELLAEAIAEAVDATVEIRDGTPIVKKLLAAELFRVGATGNDLVSDQVASLGNAIVDTLVEAGADPQQAAVDAAQTAATMTTGRWFASQNPSPETLAQYYAGQMRGINAINTLNKRREERAAPPPAGPVLSPLQIAAKYAERNRNAATH